MPRLRSKQMVRPDSIGRRSVPMPGTKGPVLSSDLYTEILQMHWSLEWLLAIRRAIVRTFRSSEWTGPEVGQEADERRLIRRSLRRTDVRQCLAQTVHRCSGGSFRRLTIRQLHFLWSIMINFIATCVFLRNYSNTLSRRMKE